MKRRTDDDSSRTEIQQSVTSLVPREGFQNFDGALGQGAAQLPWPDSAA